MAENDEWKRELLVQVDSYEKQGYRLYKTLTLADPIEEIRYCLKVLQWWAEAGADGNLLPDPDRY